MYDLKLGLTCLAMLATTGCASLRVGSDYDRDVSFETRETYDWVAVPEEESADIERVNPFIERRMRRAVDVELEAAGFRRVEEGPVDFFVSVTVLDPEEAAQRGRAYGLPLMVGLSIGYSAGLYPYGYFGYPSYWGRRYSRYGWGYGRIAPFGYYRPYFGYPYGVSAYAPYGYYGGRRGGDLETLAPGTFVVDVLDGESEELIWRGWANGALSYVPDVDELPEFIAGVVHDIMLEFPPGRVR